MKVIRIKYIKEEYVKYVSHLETIKVFQRAIRRSGLKAKYSQGFNPQMHLIFGLPLPVGVTSEAEYADVFFEVDYLESEVFETLKKHVPDGFTLISCKTRENNLNIMSEIEYADYEIKICGKVPLEETVRQLTDLTVIKVVKVKDKKEKEIDIKPFIISMSTDGKVLFLTCKAGNESNLHPRVFISAISRYVDDSVTEVSIKRKELYAMRDGIMYHPLDKKILN